MEAWTAILKINYWPIFAIGKDILEHLPSDIALQVLRRLRLTAASVNGTGVTTPTTSPVAFSSGSSPLRKYWPPSTPCPLRCPACPLGRWAKMEGVDWSDPDAIGMSAGRRFACGTGALLSAVYEQIASRHESAAGDAAAIHPVMMEEVLYGCDVMPSAIHITGSTLAGIQPDVMYGRSRLYTMPYGRCRTTAPSRSAKPGVVAVVRR